MNANPEYPISESDPGSIESITGKPLSEINMDMVDKGVLHPEDIRIRAESLAAQARIAERAGYHLLAENLTRAAELTRVPDSLLLVFYEALRPGRSTYKELTELADRLEFEFLAVSCARFIRESAEAYKTRRLLRNPS